MSSDDFFNSELTSPPKQTASLGRRKAAGGGRSAAPAPPPPPPPRPRPGAISGTSAAGSSATGATTATAAATTTTTTTTARPRPPTRPTTTATTRARPSSAMPTARSTNTTSASRGAAAAPVMTRPVGQYYASSSRPTSAATATATNSGSAMTAATTTTTTTTTAGFYGGGGGVPVAAAPAATNNNNNNNNNWAVPAASAMTTNANAWAAPVAAPVASTNDWYSGGGGGGAAPAAAASTAATANINNNSNNNNMYASAGFYEGAGTATGSGVSSFQNPGIPQPQARPQSSFLSGSMDESSVTTAHAGGSITGAGIAPTLMQPQTFLPQANNNNNNNNNMHPSSSHSTGWDNNNNNHNHINNHHHALGDADADELPLLEELGINLRHIAKKSKAVILPIRQINAAVAQMEPADILQDSDLAGPIAFCLLLGAEMVLALGKLQFGYIYFFGVFGCLSMTLIVNLMNPQATSISVWTVSSVLGYALIPVNILAAVKLIVINLGDLQTLGRLLGLLTVAWSTVASTRLLEVGCGLREQRYLIAYPIALLYSAFVMITIF